MVAVGRIRPVTMVDWPQAGADGNDAIAIELVTALNGTTALTAGMAVILKKASLTLETLAVDITTSTDDLEVCGMAYETIAAAGTGRIQIFGPTAVLKVDGSTDVAAGSHLGTITPAGTAATSTTAHARFATAMEAYATNDALGIIDALVLCRNMRGW